MTTRDLMVRYTVGNDGMYSLLVANAPEDEAGLMKRVADLHGPKRSGYPTRPGDVRIIEAQS